MNSISMKKISVCLVLIMSMMFATGPLSKAQAAMISTQTMVYAQKAEKARADINTLLKRDDIQKALTTMGISPDEAQMRAAALSDDEAVSFADRMQNAPAGGDIFGAILGTAIFIFLLLLITDILGFTKVYSFTRSVR